MLPTEIVIKPAALLGDTEATLYNLLRMAVYEFLFQTSTPKTVAINEALEIARRFSTHEATQFINGILDAIKRDLETQVPQEMTAGSLAPQLGG